MIVVFAFFTDILKNVCLAAPLSDEIKYSHDVERMTMPERKRLQSDKKMFTKVGIKAEEE